MAEKRRREKHDGCKLFKLHKHFFYKELWEKKSPFSPSDLSGCATSDPVPSITTTKT